MKQAFSASAPTVLFLDRLDLAPRSLVRDLALLILTRRVEKGRGVELPANVTIIVTSKEDPMILSASFANLTLCSTGWNQSTVDSKAPSSDGALYFAIPLMAIDDRDYMREKRADLYYNPKQFRSRRSCDYYSATAHEQRRRAKAAGAREKRQTAVWLLVLLLIGLLVWGVSRPLSL